MKFRVSILLFFMLGIVSLSAQTSKLIFPQKPGMVSYTYRVSFSKDVATTLDTIKSLGIIDMEFSNLFKRTAIDIREMLDERDMVCSSFGVGYSDLTSKTHEVGQNAVTLGANYVRMAWIPVKDKFTLELAKELVDNFNKVGKILKEEYGLTFCYHNHGYEFRPYKNGTFFDYIVQNTNPEYVSFEIDILWAFFPGADPVELLLKYPERFKLMHLKDLRKGVKGDYSGKTPIENDVALGSGQLNLPSILKVAQKTGIKHYYIEDESLNYAKQVPQSMAYLKELTENDIK